VQDPWRSCRLTKHYKVGQEPQNEQCALIVTFRTGRFASLHRTIIDPRAREFSGGNEFLEIVDLEEPCNKRDFAKTNEEANLVKVEVVNSCRVR
jgi:hypothetical protein